MTNNHLLLYHLAELMLEKQQHILPVDELFEDEQIGGFVRSINIDSPYQQMLLQGVLTETVNNKQVMVSFTVEGYFHHVLGEVIYNQAEGKEPRFLKNIIENNQLKGAIEGVEQCLIRDVENDDLSSLMWLIDEGGKALEVCASPLAHAFSIIKGNPKTEEEKEDLIKQQVERVLSELLEDEAENDFDVIIIAISLLQIAQLNLTTSAIYRLINNQIVPKNKSTVKLLIK